MQITGPLASNLPNTAPTGPNQTVTRNPNASREVTPTIARIAPVAEPEINESGAAVDLVVVTRQPAAPEHAAATFAEVWKDGRKVAEVDMHGGVTSLDGSVPPHTGASGAIPEQAARRAAQVAQAVGGELRSGGVLTDLRTLVTATRLRRAYAS